MFETFGGILEKYGTLYLQGVWLTAQLTFLSLFVGFLFAWPLALIRATKNPRWLHAPVHAFIYFMTGTPMLVQLFLVYYGLSQFEAVRDSIAWTFLREAYWCALIVFTLNTTAYACEIFRGAITATAKGEIEAAVALGMSRARRWWRIVIPSALRRALPAYGNEMIFLMHGTALASVITLVDLTGAAGVAYYRTLAHRESYLIAIVLYMMLAATIILGIRLAEKRLLRHLAR